MEETGAGFYNQVCPPPIAVTFQMPTYEYVCKSCGNHLEVFQSFKDKPLKTHDNCGGELQKRFHASGIVFKGSGFYATDSRSSSSTKSPGTDTPAKKGDSTPAKPKPKAEASSTTNDT